MKGTDPWEVERELGVAGRVWVSGVVVEETREVGRKLGEAGRVWVRREVEVVVEGLTETWEEVRTQGRQEWVTHRQAGWTLQHRSQVVVELPNEHVLNCITCFS